MSERFGDASWRPAVDVYETEKAVVVLVELAGVSRDEVRITVDGPVLRIRGVRSPERDADIRRLHQMEIAQGPFERTLRIGLPFQREGVRASLDEGFLRVVLPKRGPRRIPVGPADVEGEADERAGAGAPAAPGGAPESDPTERE